MKRKILGYFTLPLLLFLSNSSGNSAPQLPGKSPDGPTGTRERLIAGSGSVTMILDLNRLSGRDSATHQSKLDTFRFEVGSSSFFTIRLFNDVLRGAEPGSLELIWGNSGILPAPLNASSHQLVVERIPSGGPFELVVRDGKTGFVFFNIEGNLYEYDAAAHLLSAKGGRLLMSEELANRLGSPASAGARVGEISITTTMYPIEITTVVNGAVRSSILPPRGVGTPNAPEGSVPGPDIVVGDMSGLAQFGANASQVGLGVGTTSCNNGNVPVHFYQLPDPDHSVVSQNLYRMSGGASNNDRFEQIGQAWVKHTFGASQDDACGFGCTPFPDDTELGVGCSDAYAASQNASQTDHAGALGSRAWVNPFTGAFPVSPRPDNHSGHTHSGTSHRILVNATDLNTTMNTGATYYAEVQYDSPHEYAWCQAHAGECNMYNNASYRRYNVTGTTSFSFSAVGATVRMTPATAAWVGATTNTIEPAPGVDGRAFVVCKVTNPSAGVWHYEYAIHNQNLDRSIQSFSVPLEAGVTVTNIGFHAPPNHPGFPNDGTVGNAGFSNAAWTSNQTVYDVTWNSETLGENPNANAIRFATMYNFRFDSDHPPQTTNATIGFFKTGTPITVAIQGPSGGGGATPTPPPTPTPTPTQGTPTPTASATGTPTPVGTITPTATPSASPSLPPVAQPLNLSTRLRVQGGDNVGIGGFIITGSAPKQLLLRAIGPSLSGVGIPNPLADPIMELHGPTGFTTIINDQWRSDQEAEIIATGIAPTDDLEAAILATLDPGAYTAIVRGRNDSSGIALIEAYDLSPAVPAKLSNISTRAFVGTGNEIVIAGFILGNSTGNGRIVVRGLGPSLAAAGVPNALADPTLELRDSNGALLLADNDWQDHADQAADITAVGLAPSDDLEAAIAATLPPGAYTALLTGRSNGTGNGLVEVYDLGLAPAAYLQTNLVSDLAGMASHTDPNLVNPWGIATSATSPFWVSDNRTGLSTLYNTSGTIQSLVVTVPPATTGAGSPTGIVFNSSSDFQGGRFIFATEDGTISGWASGTNAVLRVDRSGSGAVYKGLAIGNNGTANFLYAANFHAGTIDVFDAVFAPATLAGSFSDSTIPGGYAPFNIQNIGGVLYVTYALQDASAHDDIPGLGHGFINKFDLNGNFLARFASRGTLNSPWGLALAPAGFGAFANTLLVGNFGDGRINVFDPFTGALLGQLANASGHAISIEGLWGLKFGNGSSGGEATKLYFAAGIAGPDAIEDHGLFGSIETQ